MVKPRILDKNLLVMKRQIGTATHQFNGEKIDVYRSINDMKIIVEYKGESVIWNIREMMEESIELINGVPLEEEKQ